MQRAETPVERTFAPIAGIAMVHVAPAGLDVGQAMPADWRGSRPAGRPLLIRHEVGPTSSEGLRPLVSAPPPYGTFYGDEAGNLAILASPTEGDPPQLLRTIVPGEEYVLRHAMAGQARADSWKWPRTLLLNALAERRRGFGAHACGASLAGGRGVLFPGVSGAGKSTLARLLAAHADGATVLSDDRIAVTEEPTGWTIWGTPWHSASKLADAGDAPLVAIVFLRHSTQVSARALPAGEAARRLLRTIALPFWNADLMDDALGRLDRLVAVVPSIELGYPPDARAVEGLEAALARFAASREGTRS